MKARFFHFQCDKPFYQITPFPLPQLLLRLKRSEEIYPPIIYKETTNHAIYIRSSAKEKNIKPNRSSQLLSVTAKKELFCGTV